MDDSGVLTGEKLKIEPRLFSDLDYQSDQFSIQYSHPEPGVLKVIYSGFASLNDIKTVYRHSLIINERLCKLPGNYCLLSDHLEYNGNDFKAQRYALRHFRWDTPKNLVSTAIVGLSAGERILIGMVMRFAPKAKVRHFATESEALNAIRGDLDRAAFLNSEGDNSGLRDPEPADRGPVLPSGLEDILEEDFSIVTEHIKEGTFFFKIEGDLNKESLLCYIALLERLEPWAKEHNYEFINILDTLNTRWRSDIYKLLYEILPDRPRTAYLTINIASPRRKGYVGFLKKLFPDILRHLEFATSREDALAFLSQREHQASASSDVLVIPNNKKDMLRIIREQEHKIKLLEKENLSQSESLAKLVTNYLMADHFEPNYVDVQPFDHNSEFYDNYNLLQYDLENLLKDLRLEVSERRQAELEAEKANQAKSKFLAVMSHELRTPLNSLLGFSQVLLLNKQENLSSDQIDYLKRMQRAGKHLLNQVNDLLDLSKLEAGKIDLVMEPVYIQDLFQDIEDSLAVQAKQHQLDFRTQASESARSILTDKRALQQILLNLVANAIKFTNQGKVRVQLLLNKQMQPHKILIKDTGIGIEKQDLERIFEPFTQVDTGEKRRFEGTGLGLSICNALCKELKYELKVKSQPGVGSEFVIVLNPETGTDKVQTPSIT